MTVLSWMADNQRSKLCQQKPARKIAGVIFQFAVVLMWEEKGRSIQVCEQTFSISNSTNCREIMVSRAKQKLGLQNSEGKQ